MVRFWPRISHARHDEKRILEQPLRNGHYFAQVESLVLLVKRGSASSLTELRERLGRTEKDIASLIGVPEYQIMKWEKKKEQPSSLELAWWKLKLSDYVDEEISQLLRTRNKEVIAQFWELIWRLNDSNHR